MSDTYKIKPLRWSKHFDDWRQCFHADVPFGDYDVVREREDCDESKPWGSWRWEYCFNEYYNEGTADCRSAIEGKLLAEADWLKRLLPALEQPQPPTAQRRNQ